MGLGPGLSLVKGKQAGPLQVPEELPRGGALSQATLAFSWPRGWGSQREHSPSLWNSNVRASRGLSPVGTEAGEGWGSVRPGRAVGFRVRERWHLGPCVPPRFLWKCLWDFREKGGHFYWDRGEGLVVYLWTGLGGVVSCKIFCGEPGQRPAGATRCGGVSSEEERTWLSQPACPEGAA